MSTRRTDFLCCQPNNREMGGETTVMAAPLPMDEEEKVIPPGTAPATTGASAPSDAVQKHEAVVSAKPTAGSISISAPPAVFADAAPCRTLYVRGLDEKRKPAVLRTLLHAFFSPYGEISWISASRALKLRGQAFITFTDVECATAALRGLAGTEFLGQLLQLHYARTESFRPQPKAKRNAAAVAIEADKRKKKRPAPAPTTGDQAAVAPRVKKRQKVVPNRILFAEDVPTGGMLTERCARFAGFIEVRSVPSKPSIAFVEFQSEQHAAVALAALNSTVIKDDTPPVRLSYAKK